MQASHSVSMTAPAGLRAKVARRAGCGQLRGAAAPLATRASAPRCTARAKQALTVVAAAQPKKILMMGGTRFIGVYIARELVRQGHEVTICTRGKSAITSQIPDDTDEFYNYYKFAVRHIAADRKDGAGMKEAFRGENFDVVYDLNGREAVDTKYVLDAVGGVEQYIYCSSAGVYLKTDCPPHMEPDAGDYKSRHKGKIDTESLLIGSGVNFTSIRPVYVYGPLNYNPVEEWFFHRLAADRPVPIPGSGLQITQMGHVADLADAFVKCLGNPKAKNQIYNIAGDRYVTFDGLAKACATAMGKPEPELVHYKPKDFDFGKKKAFPFRDQHFFASIEKAKADLDWAPKFSLVDGLRDSYEKDFGRGNFREAADFTCDDMILAKVGNKGAFSAPAAPKPEPAKASSTWSYSW